jgi:hypothetical protein
MVKKFEVGEPYFLVHYADKKYKYPDITTLVFIGMNLEDDGEQDKWFFQDPHSYVESGAYPFMSRGKIDVEVYDFPEDQLVDLHSANELFNAGAV